MLTSYRKADDYLVNNSFEGFYKQKQTALEIKYLTETAKRPMYATDGAAGMDICADLPMGPVTIKPGFRVLIPSGLAFALPEGFEIQVRPRSGLALKNGVTVVNSPGTVDSDYRGPVGVILINHGTEDFIVNHGDRIAQLVIATATRLQMVTVEEFSTSTERGAGGFGHTGVAT